MQTEKLISIYLKREVIVEVLLPRNYHTHHPQCRLLVLNDGQDAAAFQIREVFQDLEAAQKMLPTVALAVHVGERKQEYGVSNRPDFAKRGSKARQYAQFIEFELIPWAHDRFRLHKGPAHTAIAGFSLGALSAFDLAWHSPHIFGKVGLFSGSFWWRSKALDDGYQPSDRIALQVIEEASQHAGLKFWFQTGWLDERADRDADGLIDSIGDTLDVMLALTRKGYQPGTDIAYVELGAGHHDHKTMAKILPRFLQWVELP